MEYLDITEIKTLFSSLLQRGIHGADNNSKDLETLLQQFPYCQSLYAIQAVQNKNNSTFNSHLSKAALYSPDRTVLYDLINPKSTSIPVQKPDEKTADLENLKIEETIKTPTESIEDVHIIETETLFINDIETVIPEWETPSLESKQNRGNENQEKPIFDTLASSDYFKFNESNADPLARSMEGSQSDSEQVSKYDDDTMPYSFLWWLHKTRNEHADTYQPYVSFKLDTTQKIKKNPAEELNHQIIENIFHLQVPLKDTSETPHGNNTVQFELKRKEDDIIEKFIKEEPQIRPPKPELIDTENKARKSSEDNLDLVSETLANIYIEQMLYHKAIDTYRKLSLKFPEKSTYFADQIIEIQKKIN